MSKAVIAGYVRSPFHFAGKGALTKVRPDDLAATVVKGLIQKTGVKPDDIEDLILGCAFPEGEQGLNVARLIGLIAGLPQSVAGATLNRFCGSSMQGIHMAAGAIAMGAGQAFICAGQTMTLLSLPRDQSMASFSMRLKASRRMYTLCASRRSRWFMTSRSSGL